MTLDAFLRQFAPAFESGLSPVALGVVFLAGIVASAVCPCTLPVGLGMASAAGASETAGKGRGLKIATAFFVGIVLNLTILGLLAARLGELASERFGRYWALGMCLMSLAAAVLAFFGPRLKAGQLAHWRGSGILGALGYGFVFSLGTSVAPLLLLLTVSAASASVFQGLVLAVTFGLGRGLPFLLAGVAASSITGLTRLGLSHRTIQLPSGCALLLVSGYYARTFFLLL